VAQVEEHGIRFIRLWLSDILRLSEKLCITTDELEGALDEGMGFDGSSIIGYQTIEESDMIAKPDPSTFAILPWRPKEKALRESYATCLNRRGSPIEGDPRYVLKRNLQRAEKKGLTFNIGPELEYFYFANNQCADIIDTGGYFDLTPWIRLLIFGETRYLRYKTWAFRVDIVTTRLALANTRLICATRTL